MTDKTRTELVNQALVWLFVVSSGQEGEAEDYAVCDALVDALIDQLSADQVCYISDVNAIEPEFFLPLSRLLANEASTLFSQQYSADAKAIFEQQLRRLVATRPTYAVLRTDYF